MLPYVIKGLCRFTLSQGHAVVARVLVRGGRGKGCQRGRCGDGDRWPGSVVKTGGGQEVRIVDSLQGLKKAGKEILS